MLRVLFDNKKVRREMLGLCCYGYIGIRCFECFYFMDSVIGFKSRLRSVNMWVFIGRLVVLMS